MNEPIITDAAPAPQPQADPQLYVGLEGIEVQFPDGYWDNPVLDLVVRGRARREWAIDNIALTIASGLRKMLADRRPSSSGLVDVNGRPLSF